MTLILYIYKKYRTIAFGYFLMKKKNKYNIGHKDSKTGLHVSLYTVYIIILISIFYRRILARIIIIYYTCRDVLLTHKSHFTYVII